MEAAIAAVRRYLIKTTCTNSGFSDPSSHVFFFREDEKVD